MSQSQHERNIKLEEAMTRDLTQSVRVWYLQGLHVQDEAIPENANVQTTFVLKYPEGNFHLGIQWTVKGDFMTRSGAVAEVSRLDELKEKFPNLFDLEGSLYAFA